MADHYESEHQPEQTCQKRDENEAPPINATQVKAKENLNKKKLIIFDKIG